MRRRFGRLPEHERKRTRMAKIMAFGIGALIVVGSSFLDSVPGNIWAVSTKTSSLLTAPIFGLFFFAFFVPFARPLGVGVGAILGIAAAILTAFSGLIFGMNPATGEDPVSFMLEIPLPMSSVRTLTLASKRATLLSPWSPAMLAKLQGQSVFANPFLTNYLSSA